MVNQASGIAAVLAAALAQPLAAAEPGWELAPYAGYRGGGSFEDLTTADGLDVDESASFGLSVSRPLDPGRRFEVWYSRQASEMTGEGTFTGDPLFDLDVHYLHLGGTVEIDDTGAFQPFVSGGLGVTHFDPDRGGLDSETRLSLSLGLGTRTYFTPRFGLRLDARWIGTLMDGDGAIFCVDGSCAVAVESDLFSQWELGAGLFVVF